jgi:hypothetical protein
LLGTIGRGARSIVMAPSALICTLASGMHGSDAEVAQEPAMAASASCSFKLLSNVATPGVQVIETGAALPPVTLTA